MISSYGEGHGGGGAAGLRIFYNTELITISSGNEPLFHNYKEGFKNGRVLIGYKLCINIALVKVNTEVRSGIQRTRHLFL